MRGKVAMRLFDCILVIGAILTATVAIIAPVAVVLLHAAATVSA